MNAACASGSDFGCCGRDLQTPETQCRQLLATLRSCRTTPNSTAIRRCRSRRRQRTTPSRTRSGPASTQAASAASLNPGRKRGQLVGCQPPGPLRHRPVRQSGEAFGIVAVHPFVGETVQWRLLKKSNCAGKIRTFISYHVIFSFEIQYVDISVRIKRLLQQRLSDCFPIRLHPLDTRRSSTLFLPRDFGKNSRIRPICASVNQKPPPMKPPQSRKVNHTANPA